MSRLERLKLVMVLANATAIAAARLTFKWPLVMVTAVAGCVALTVQPPELESFILSPFDVPTMLSPLRSTRPSALATPLAGANAVT